MRPKDHTKEIWNGIRLGEDLAPKTLLADQAFDIALFFEKIDSIVTDESSVYFDVPGNGGWKDYSSTNVLNKKIHSIFKESLLPLNPHVSEMRLIKDENEVRNMQHAADIAAEAHLNAMQASQPGLYEYQIMAGFDSKFRQANCDHAYPPCLLYTSPSPRD